MQRTKYFYPFKLILNYNQFKIMFLKLLQKQNNANFIYLETGILFSEQAYAMVWNMKKSEVVPLYLSNI